ncbi:MraY family glycosyltransferase [Methanocaldococcus fervens]|uniref:Glycosyl transferase, family 4, conserved region n=1 Tax=Methanocaldococcus fervens (strain DSM 4213 / JCM 15782 / AG86) TaxID=573064 RepID=C7P6F8_METFA|nr:glycosyltransferase 4 family protein [Methanocaldococcus fervens]ACV24140.1 Glycosyl transferase, family 4, conserved region [Methanocaldococcus fervens AG86]
MIYLAIFAFVFSAVFCYFLIKKMVNYKFSYDLHKKEKVKVPEMGGLAVLFSNALFIPFVNPTFILPIVAAGIIGVVDDIAKLSPKEKLILLFTSGLIVGVLFYNSSYISWIDILIVAFGIMIFSNLTNMLAGFNGLEIGMGVIASTSLAVVLFLDNCTSGFLSALIVSASYFGLLIFNKYPAKIFPGDVGTLPIGAFLASLAVIYKEYVSFLIIMMPYIIDASLKYLSAGVMSRDEHKPTTLGEDGRLYYIGGYLSLPRLILKYKAMKEYQLVLILWIIGALFGMAGILIASII